MFRTALRSSLGLLRTSAPLVTPSSRLFAYRSLTQEARSSIQKAIEASPVVLFMKGTPQVPECGFSRAVVQVLGAHEVPMEKLKSYNVLADPELRSSIKEFSEWPTVPQLYVNGEFIGGCDIIMGMHQSGELEDLLVKHNIIPEFVEEPQAQTTPTS